MTLLQLRRRMELAEAMGWDTDNLSTGGMMAVWRDVLEKLTRCMTIDLIAQFTGLSFTTLRGDMVKVGAKRRPDHRPPMQPNGETLNHISERTGISYATIYKRLRNDLPLDEPVDKQRVKIRINGESLGEISQRTGIPVPTIYGRWRKGRDVEKPVERVSAIVFPR